MENHSTLNAFKHQLQQHGALRPEAWLHIQQQLQQKQLKVNESFIREEGTFAYVAEGLLKEYNALNRTSPSIINFIPAKKAFVTRRHNQSHYLKACLPTLVFYLDFAQLQLIYQDFKELKSIYEALCGIYDADSSFRHLILETSSATQRIQMFREKYHHQINYLKKKDIANYLQLNYTHFLHINSNLQ